MTTPPKFGQRVETEPEPDGIQQSMATATVRLLNAKAASIEVLNGLIIIVTLGIGVPVVIGLYHWAFGQ